MPVPHLGILYIAAYLREKGLKDIRVIDDYFLNLTTDQLENEIKQADVVGVTGSTCQFKWAMEISELCKKHNVLSVMGGVHASPIPKEVLEKSEFDIVVKGEGEETFCEIVKTYDKRKDKNKTDKSIFKQLKGLVYRDNNGNITQNQDREFINNLDELPFPARDLVDITAYPTKKLARFSELKYTSLISSRGCPSACVFCSSPITWKRTIRTRSAENVVKEIKFLKEAHGFKCFHFSDDTFTVSKQRVKDFCKVLLNENLNIEWSCITRPDRVDLELFKLMKKSGCVQVDLGVESGNEDLLKVAKKYFSLNQIEAAFKAAKQAGISTRAFFLIGLPGETVKTVLNTVRFARKIKPDSCIYTVMLPFPGTEAYNKKMVKITNPNYVEWIYKKPIIKVGNLGPVKLMVLRWIAQRLTDGFKKSE